jgi:hypothetical protein
MLARGESPAFSAEDLAARRRAARKLAWILGLAVLLLYAGGFFVSR